MHAMRTGLCFFAALAWGCDDDEAHGDPDAEPAAEPASDAARVAPLHDAGVALLGEPCTHLACAPGLTCIGSGEEDVPPLCATACHVLADCPVDETCAAGGVCLHIPTAGYGDACHDLVAPRCADPFVCMPTGRFGSICRERCQPTRPPCTDGRECVVPTGGGGGFCLPPADVPLGGSCDGFFHRCADAGRCVRDSRSEVSHCFRECDAIASACEAGEVCALVTATLRLCVPEGMRQAGERCGFLDAEERCATDLLCTGDGPYRYSCHARCDVTAAQPECPPREGCEHAPDHGGVCALPGEVGEGGACAFDTRCSHGLLCVGGECRRPCDPQAEPGEACPEGVCALANEDTWACVP